MLRSKKIVRKVIIPAILLLLIVALIFKMCGGKSDSSSASGPQKQQVSIDTLLQHRIDSFVRHVPSRGSLGIMFFDATAQKEVYSLNPDSLMSPASCMKLLTSITTLRQFGSSAVHKNRLYISGKMMGDTLVGNITLKVQFDPTFNRDSLYQLTELLKARHIKHLEGKVILDMADYIRMDHEEHWTLGDLRSQYLGLPFSGGKKLRTEILYALAHINIPVRSENIVYGRLDYHNSTLVAELRSPILTSIKKALKNSSNIYAESMLYPLGYIINKKGNFRMNGLKKMRQFVANELHMNIATSCQIEDGCGLCPQDRLTPRLLVNLLNYAYHHKYIYQAVYEALPLSGTDGTLYDRLRHPKVIGKVKAKTGTLTRDEGISSLSGYFTTPDNHLIIFSIICNRCPVMDGRWWQDNLMKSIL